MKKGLFLLILVFGINSTHAQNYLDALQPFLGMEGRSGAETGYAPASLDPASSLLGNPAVLTYVEKSALSLDLSVDQIEGVSVFNSSRWDHSTQNNLVFNSISYLKPVPVYRGAWVWGVSLQPVNSFSRTSAFVHLDSDSGDVFTYGHRHSESGSLYAASLGTAFLATMNTSVGLSFSILAGQNTYEKVYTEWDNEDLFEFDTYVDSLRFSPGYFGFSGRVGLYSEFTDHVNLGFSLDLPTLISVTETSSHDEIEWQDTGVKDVYAQETAPKLEYSLRGPLKMSMGLGLNYRPILLSFNYRYLAYRWIALNGDLINPENGSAVSDIVASGIESNVENVHIYAASAQWELAALKLGLGVSLQNHPLSYYLDDVIRFDAVLGYKLSSGLGLTFALRKDKWQSDLNHELVDGSLRVVDVENNFTKLQFGLSYTFD